MIKKHKGKGAIIKQGGVLGLLALSLTGCIVSPYDGNSNGDRGRNDRGQNDAHRYEQRNDRDRNKASQSNQDRSHQPYWDQERNRNDAQSNRAR